jgi:hypothetical protein
LTGGRVTISEPGVLGKALHAGVFDGAGKGNFRIKALLEGFFKLYHYRMAALPAQTGGNARGGDRPEQLDGLEKYAAKILDAAERMEADQHGRLWFGALTWQQYARRVDSILHAINTRHEHDIEGFEANGWMEREFSIDGRTGWRSVREIQYLEKAAQNAVLDLVNVPGLSRFRKWSPLEVWDNHQDNLERLPLWCGVHLLGLENAKKVTVKNNHLIEFQDQWYGPDTFRYEGWVETPAQERMTLTPGREYGLFININDISRAVVVDEKGGILGIARKHNSVMPLDKEEVEVRQALQARARAALSAPVIERHADEASDRLAAMAHNETLIAEGAKSAPPKTKKQKQPAVDAIAALAGTLTNTTQEVQDEQW